MNEKIYKTLEGTGVLNLVLGIIALITGVTAGILLIVGGARLLRRRSDILP